MENEQLKTLLLNTDFFQSSYDARILAYLIGQTTPVTVKSIAKETGFPDSKIYPALKQLSTHDLVVQNTKIRPHQYFFNNPEKLEEFLVDKKKELAAHIDELIDSIMDETFLLWDPKEPKLGNVAYLFHDSEIPSQIIRILKNCKSDAFLLLSNQAVQYIDRILPLLEELLVQGRRVNLAYPLQSQQGGELRALASKFTNLKVKQSLWLGNSYIVRDKSILLNITHRKLGDVAILTNDELLVTNISECWFDDSCCVTPSQSGIKLETNIS